MVSAGGATRRGVAAGLGMLLAATTILAGDGFAVGPPSANKMTDVESSDPAVTTNRITAADFAPDPVPSVRTADVVAVPDAAAMAAALDDPSAELPQAAEPAGVNYTPGRSIHTREVLALVVKYFPADQVGNAMAVSRCESSHSNAIGSLNANGTRDWGVFQINDGGTLQGALKRLGLSFSSTDQARQLALDAEINVRAARNIYDSRGWAPWVCAYKVGVVAGLYSRTPGPMVGKFDERGLPGAVDLNRTKPATNTAMPEPAVPASPPPASPTPTTSDPQTPTPEPTPTTSDPQTPTPEPTPTAAALTPTAAPTTPAPETLSPSPSSPETTP